MSWLESEPEKTAWALNGTEAYPDQPLTMEGLLDLGGDLPLPTSIRTLASRADLQRRVRSESGCYLDLGQLLVPTSTPGGYLLHFLSDQQSTFHWLLYVDKDGNEGVVGTVEPLGFDYADEPEWAARQVAGIGLDPSSGLEVCADTFVEFVYRFWVENEIWFALREGRTMSGPIATYADALRGA
jgi:hypothetical protein